MPDNGHTNVVCTYVGDRHLLPGDVAFTHTLCTQHQNVTFREGDIEDLPLKDGFADCVTSNGGFCLVPDKPRAFKEIFRVLKPGGRMAVCCTTKRKKLPEGVDWPVCMNVFMMLDECAPMLEDIGFEAIDVDASNARMDLWDLDAEDVREVINGLDPEEKAKYTPEK